jgi:hypothetical protein
MNGAIGYFSTMKRILILAVATLISITTVTAQDGCFFGEKFVHSKTTNLIDLHGKMEKMDSVDVVLSAKTVTTCKKAGCWMEICTQDNQLNTRVFMKDHAFGVPLEGCEGKEAIVYGRAFRYKLSVEYLRHLAEDAGKSKEEIEKITEPETAIGIDAWGVWMDVKCN